MAVFVLTTLELLAFRSCHYLCEKVGTQQEYLSYHSEQKKRMPDQFNQERPAHY